MGRLWNVAVVGATGAVGRQTIECLEERDFPAGKVRFLANSCDAEEILDFKGKPVVVEELAPNSFEGVDIAFFSEEGDSSREYCPTAARTGAVCIDSSGVWRMDPDVPLIVPEVNAHAIAGYTKKGIIAIPDAATTQVMVALRPLHSYATITRIVVSTYQAVSGGGTTAVDELHRQVVEMLNGRSPTCQVFPHRAAFNCLPHIGPFEPNGYTGGEVAMVNETRKIMGADIRITATAVGVPVFYGHSAAVNIETVEKITMEKARELLADAPGCMLVDDPKNNNYPMPIDAAGQDLVLVGRIREDASIENGLNLWIVADNIRKGAATNAVQIAELLIANYLK